MLQKKAHRLYVAGLGREEHRHVPLTWEIDGESDFIDNLQELHPAVLRGAVDVGVGRPLIIKQIWIGLKETSAGCEITADKSCVELCLPSVHHTTSLT